MSDDVRPHDAGHGPSRRAVLRGAALGGAFVWTAPAVQAVGPSAFAEGLGTPPPDGRGLSYVGLIFRYGPHTYRVKWDIAEDGSVAEFSFGRTWKAGYCADSSPNPETYFRRGDSTISPAKPPVAALRSALATRKDGLQVALDNAAVVLDYVVHQGQCCIRMGTPTASTLPAKDGSTYVASKTPGPSNTLLYTFPPAPNKAPC